MTISFEEAAQLSSVAYNYEQPGFTLPPSLTSQGWQVLTTSQDYTSGYDGIALVKVVNGTVTELVVAHRGTEFSGSAEYADLVQDGVLALGYNGTQPTDAANFLGIVQNEYSSFLTASGNNGPVDPTNILTHSVP